MNSGRRSVGVLWFVVTRTPAGGDARSGVTSLSAGRRWFLTRGQVLDPVTVAPPPPSCDRTARLARCRWILTWRRCWRRSLRSRPRPCRRAPSTRRAPTMTAHPSRPAITSARVEDHMSRRHPRATSRFVCTPVRPRRSTDRGVLARWRLGVVERRWARRDRPPDRRPQRCTHRFRRVPVGAGAPVPGAPRRLLGRHRLVGRPRRRVGR